VLAEVNADYYADLGEKGPGENEPASPLNGTGPLDPAHALLAASLEAARDCVVVVDADGRILAHNRKFVELWNLPEPQLVGARLEDLLPNILFELTDPADFERILQSVQRDSECRLSRVLHFSDGRYFDLHSEPLPKPYQDARLWAFRDVSGLKQSEEGFRHDAFHDALTGLPNRALFIDRLGQALAHAQRREQPLAVMFLDLDRFKHVNDTLGHGAGDELLQAVAERLQARVRKQDTVSRLAGDEFMIVVTELASADAASYVAESILDSLRLPVRVEGGRVAHVGASIGIALYPHAGTDPETLLRNADIALYRAKEDGRNRYQHFEEGMTNANEGKLAFENELRGAIEAGELVVHYQPIVDLRNRSVIGAEALVRWQKPDGTLLQPNHFIPEAEQAGLVGRVSEWVLRRVGAERAQWPMWMQDQLSVSINFSSQQFWDPHLVRKITSELEAAELPTDRVVLELTESVVMVNPARGLEMLSALMDRGIRVALDDFGTGHSSLSVLRRMPLSLLKVDKSFVQRCDHDPMDGAIVRSIIEMATSLGIPVLAEGVERKEQAQFLADQGCPTVQGFWISRPVPSNRLVDWLERMPGSRVKLAQG